MVRDSDLSLNRKTTKYICFYSPKRRELTHNLIKNVEGDETADNHGPTWPYPSPESRPVTTSSRDEKAE